MDTSDVNMDPVVACADLADRSGASGFELAYLHDDVPVEEAGWWAAATYQGARLSVEDHRSPAGAAMALAERLLRGATCRCGAPVSLSDAAAGCRWRLLGTRWTPGCTEPAVRVRAPRGDIAAMNAALTVVRNAREQAPQHPRRGRNRRRG